MKENELTELAQQDFTVIDDFLPMNLAEEIQRDLLKDISVFRPAGIGPEGTKESSVRADFIKWWDESNLNSALNSTQLKYLEVINQLMEELNREFFLGLKGFEAHYAMYPTGAFYKPHFDNSIGSRRRVISTVFYLNSSWADLDGGELDLVEKGKLISPQFNRFVIFKSDSVLHQVRPARRERLSVTGWFYVGSGGVI